MIDWLQLTMAAGEAAPKGPSWEILWFLGVIFIMFWLLIIRPQKREQQQKERLLSTVERGDRVVTIGGIHGTVTSVDEPNKIVTIDVGKGVKIEFSRAAVSSIEKKKKAGEEAPKENPSNDKK